VVSQAVCKFLIYFGVEERTKETYMRVELHKVFSISFDGLP
jgi:hypothetical protein